VTYNALENCIIIFDIFKEIVHIFRYFNLIQKSFYLYFYIFTYFTVNQTFLRSLILQISFH